MTAYNFYNFTEALDKAVPGLITTDREERNIVVLTALDNLKGSMKTLEAIQKGDGSKTVLLQTSAQTEQMAICLSQDDRPSEILYADHVNGGQGKIKFGPDGSCIGITVKTNGNDKAECNTYDQRGVFVRAEGIKNSEDYGVAISSLHLDKGKGTCLPGSPAQTAVDPNESKLNLGVR